MGVPSFYRWLVSRYPKVVVSVIDEEPTVADDSWVASAPPNGLFDNLYLDMNGIIHPCFHPEDQILPPTTEDEVFLSIFRHIDRIIGVIRPRKLLYLAIDGVAPRAKINQQRSRRFRAAKDAEFAEAEEERLRREFHLKGKPVLPKAETQLGDSNLITPGTAFMSRLSGALQYYIRSRLNNCKWWKNLKVILSDANVPGEGEHKVMAFIRSQRSQPGYDPNTRHCLYGLDADLILLALATHEPHFFVLREDVMTKTSQDISSALESSLPEPVLERLQSNSSVQGMIARKIDKKPLQLLNIWTVREYLEQDFTIQEAPFKLDIERIVDDFVFICFFAGNDFLPRIPSIDINENALDLLIHVYKSEFKNMGGYLIDTSRIKEKKAAFVKAKRVDVFIQAVGGFETKIFMKRYNLMQAKLKRIMRQKMEIEGYESLGSVGESCFETVAIPSSVELSSLVEKCSIRNSTTGVQNSEVIRNTEELFMSLKKCIRDKGDLFKNEIPGNDKIKLGIPGWEDRYYSETFSLKSCSEIQQLKKEIVQKYTEGLAWTLMYYYSGVCSWQWYYPFHYAPFAVDLRGIPWSSLSFKLGKPIKPFEQLLSVLPPRSAHALPESYGNLMTCNESSLALFYPNDFEVDTFGKRFLWQGIVKLPFIEEGLVIAEAKKLENDLKDEDKARNSIDFDRIFVLNSHNLASEILSGSRGKYSRGFRPDRIDSSVDGMNGYLCSSVDQIALRHGRFPSPLVGMDHIEEDMVVCSAYVNPDAHDHVSRLLEGVEIPEKTITASDIEWRPLWHEHHGSRPPADMAPTPKHFFGRGRAAAVTPSGLSGYGSASSAWRPKHHDAPRSIGRGRTTSETVGDRSLTGLSPICTQAITAPDIEWRPLWHEHHGSRPPADVAPTPKHFSGRGRAAAITASGLSGYGSASSAWRPKHHDAPRSIGRGRTTSENAPQPRGFGTSGQQKPSGGW